MNKNQIAAIVIITLLLQVLLDYWQNGTLSFANFQNQSALAAGFGGLIFLFDNYAWSWPFVNQILAENKRCINGTWKVVIDSNYVESDSNEPVAPIPGFMRIHQTYSKLELKLLTKESSSDSLGSKMFVNSDKTWSLICAYQNNPEFVVRDDSDIHFGGMILKLIGNPVSTMQGRYWTDRKAKTGGAIVLSDRMTGLYDSYETAQSANLKFENAAGNSK